MNKWCVCIVWSVFTLNVANSSTDMYESSTFLSPDAVKSRRKIFKLGTSKNTGAMMNLTDNRSALMISAQRVCAESPQHIPEVKPTSKFTSPSPLQIQRTVHPKRPDLRSKEGFTSLPDVSVSCSTSELVLRVRRSFYGFGADTKELTLGVTCKSNGVVRPRNDMLFTYHLTDCDGKSEEASDSFSYKFVLHYVPSPIRFRARSVNLNVVCRFPRYHHVYRLAVRPTWSSHIMHKTLKWRSIDFQIQLMDDSWTTPAQYQVYLLGQTVNFQVTALHLPHGSLKLFIRNCYATTTSGTSATYNIIDNFGCMQESRRNLGRARFVSPRTDDSLRFSLSAFQFTSDPHVQVTMHCNVFLTSEEPGPLHKSCSYTEHG
ncbi:zona pellucida sperm-binding protein 3 isoform X1 [Hypomesus transpacificus]|uniref:zona pellucida sperm-binding protein 3 isoform X1 n=1 Tax=Hypomesus transpacificus TaxID=137520 RepID=UPI001F074D4A|nr:zona pellucida sperm-binding protein 3 isoform X1 [Hypomesus transpacificus]